MMSQSVSNNKASGWTAEESLMKTTPLDLTAVKKVNQRLGNSSFPLQEKRKKKCVRAPRRQTKQSNYEKHADLFTEERCSRTGPLKVRKDTCLGRKRPLATTPFFT